MIDRNPDIVLGTPCGTKVQEEAARFVRAKETAEQRAAKQAKLEPRMADLAVEGATEDLMMPDHVNVHEAEIAAAEQALQGDLVDLAPAHGSKGATADQVE